MGCDPVYSDNKTLKCPVRYDCSKVLDVRKEDKCYYKGVEYNQLELLEDLPLLPFCRRSCKCEGM